MNKNDSIVVMYPDETLPPLQSPKCSGSRTLTANQSCTSVQNIIMTTGLSI